MKSYTVRLKPGQFFKEEIERLVIEKNIKAGVILAAVGGLENAIFRTSKFDSGEHPIKEIEGPLELVSCEGTLSKDGCHIHVSVSNREGICYGGHLKDGCKVFVTIELVIGVFDDVTYSRTLDTETGFNELTAQEL
jgi:predicted DNA-binding protein with PD1-like motif